MTRTTRRSDVTPIPNGDEPVVCARPEQLAQRHVQIYIMLLRGVRGRDVEVIGGRGVQRLVDRYPRGGACRLVGLHPLLCTRPVRDQSGQEGLLRLR